MTEPQKEEIVSKLSAKDLGTDRSLSKSKDVGNRQRLVRSDSFSDRLALNHSRFAKKVHDFGYIYSLYALLDAEILAYTGLKYFFDVLASNKGSANPMRDWLLTPTGIVTASVESVALIGLSLVANNTEENDSRAYRQAIMTLWPYCRNIISELKNSNKSVRNTLKVAALVHETSFNSMMMPVGLLVGATSVLNRIWFRRLQDQRKELKDEFKALLKELPNLELNGSEPPDASELVKRKELIEEYYKRIPHEMDSQQRQAYLSAAYNGMMEGLAYYIAPLTLMAFTSPAFIPVASVCIVLSAAAVTSRIYEEYEYQRGLELETLGIKLQLKQRELALLKAQQTQFSLPGIEITQVEELFPQITRLREEFNAKSAGMVNHALRGVKNGLAVYAVITKVLMTSLMFFSTVPIALLVSNAIIGVALLVGSTIYSLSKYYEKQAKVQENSNEKKLVLGDIYGKANRLLAELIEAHTMASTPPGSSFYTGWLEVVRAFFSGLNKGQKLIGYILAISFLEVSLQSDFQDKPIVLKTSVALGVFCSVVLSLRVYALNFGSKPQQENTAETDQRPEELDFIDLIEAGHEGNFVVAKQPPVDERDEIATLSFLENNSGDDPNEEFNPDVMMIEGEEEKETESTTNQPVKAMQGSNKLVAETVRQPGKRVSENHPDGTPNKKSKTTPETETTAAETDKPLSSWIQKGMLFFNGLPFTHFKHPVKAEDPPRLQ